MREKAVEEGGISSAVPMTWELSPALYRKHGSWDRVCAIYVCNIMQRIILQFFYYLH